MNVSTDTLAWGFLVSEKPLEASADWEFIVTRSAAVAPIQFCRVHLDASGSPSPTELFLVRTNTPPIDAQTLAVVRSTLAHERNAAVVVAVLEDREGYAAVEPLLGIQSELIAVAVAFSKVSGLWDESDPVSISIGEQLFHVRVTYGDSRLHASVEEAG